MPLNFAATSQRVQLPDSINAVRNVPGATLCGWVNLTSIVNNSVLLSLTVSTGRTTSRCRLSAAGFTSGRVRGSGTALDADAQQIFESATLSVTPGIWTFIAGTWDFVNRRMKLYLNTTSDLSPVLGWTSGNCSNTFTLANTIGNYDPAAANAPLHGLAEDARVYNRILSDAELQTIYNCQGSDGIFYGLQVRCLMNEKADGYVCLGGEIVKDYQGQFDGTASVGATYTEGFIKKARLIH